MADRKKFAFIIEVHPESMDGDNTMDDCLTNEQMRIMLLACAGFQLTREELAEIRQPYVQLMREWGRIHGVEQRRR